MAMEAAHTQCSKCRADVFAGACFCIQCGSRLEQPAHLPSSVRLVVPPAVAKQRADGTTRYSITLPRVSRR